MFFLAGVWLLAAFFYAFAVCLEIADSTGFKPSRHLQTALGLATTSWRGRHKMRIQVHSSLGWWQELQEASGIHVFRKVSFILWEFLQQGSSAFGQVMAAFSCLGRLGWYNEHTVAEVFLRRPKPEWKLFNWNPGILDILDISQTELLIESDRCC